MTFKGHLWLYSIYLTGYVLLDTGRINLNMTLIYFTRLSPINEEFLFYLNSVTLTTDWRQTDGWLSPLPQKTLIYIFDLNELLNFAQTNFLIFLKFYLEIHSLNFLSEELCSELYDLKNQWTSAGFEKMNLGHRDDHFWPEINFKSEKIHKKSREEI